LSVLGIEHSKNKMVGGGALLDIARFHWVEWMQDDHSISNGEHDKCAKARRSPPSAPKPGGVEMRPNETKRSNMDLCMGEIFYLKELAEDCAKDEFFFCGALLIITGTRSPINPQAIK
jgi:hypothetical protein